MTNMQRIDTYPTHTYGGYKLRPGQPFPFGATSVPGGVNFSIYSAQATSCTLVLFRKGEAEPLAEIVFPVEFRIGNVFSMTVFDLDYESTEYGYRMEGPYNPKEGHRFDPTKILMDPYARAIGGRDVWGAAPNWNDVYQHRSRLVYDEFENSKVNQQTGEMLYNYWGYSTVGFFAPKAGFASTGKRGMQVDELKTL